MSRARLVAALLAAPLLTAPLLTGPAQAEPDFSEGSEARPWNLTGEVQARFKGRVVDMLCELTGDCPADCGAGARQLGIVRSVDGVLTPVLKNAQASFNGAVEDLLPYCGQMVEVDGNMIGDDEINTTYRFFQVQRIRPEGDEAFARANRWTDAWAEKNPDAAGPGPWFRRDPRVNALIARDGYLGLGLEADAAFIEYLFGE